MKPSDTVGFGVIRKPTPPCPKGLYEYRCEYSDIDLVCHLEYFPAERGSVDSLGAPYEPSTDEAMDLVSIYIAGTDVDVYPIIAVSFVNDIERFALIEFREITP
jgi:hypothetical protein